MLRSLRHLGKPVVRKPLPANGANSAPPLDIISLVDSYYYETGNAPSSKRDGYFHPSSGLLPEFEGCRRRALFGLMMAPPSPTNIPSVIQRIFDNGHNRHLGLQAKLSSMAAEGFRGIVAFAAEVPVKHHTLPIIGHMDGVLSTVEGHTYVVDFKTINDDGWKNLYGPKPQHVAQLNTYLALSGYRAGYLLYENKNNQKWAGPSESFRVNYDPALWARSVDYCVGLLRDLHEHRIADFDEKTCKAEVQGCSFKASCNAHLSGEATLADLDMRSAELVSKHRLPLIRGLHANEEAARVLQGRGAHKAQVRSRPQDLR